MNEFERSWVNLRSVVESVPDRDFAAQSGCRGWLVRDLVCHLVIDAQDVLITLATPTESATTVDAATYWDVVEPPTGEDPLDALIPRLAAAYGDSALLKFHLADLGAAAGRAATQADLDGRVETKAQVLTTSDFLQAYVLEWTLHHLDLITYLPTLPGPDDASLAASRRLLEIVSGRVFPESLSDRDALLIGTGRREPTPAERDDLGDLATALPCVLG